MSDAEQKQIALELFNLAEELSRYTVDNGPMGEDRPFTDKAGRLRAIARQLSKP